MHQSKSVGRCLVLPGSAAVFRAFEFNFDVRHRSAAVVAVAVVAAVDRLPVSSATELAVVSSKAALASAGMDPGLIDATFVGNVIQSRFVIPNADYLTKKCPV